MSLPISEVISLGEPAVTVSRDGRSQYDSDTRWVHVCMSATVYNLHTV